MQKTLLRIKSIESYKWIMAIAILAAGVHFALILFVIFSRINYRYDLEWMEGASLLQAYRISMGQRLYLQPSLEYIPLIYPPLYFYLSAILVKIIGISFLPLRIVSFASTLGCFLIIYYAVKDKTDSALIGFVAAGSFAATFRLGGAWFDIARVDMLFIFLCLAAVYFLGKHSIKDSIVAGILFSLAFLTKQTAISIFAVMALSTFILFRKQTIPFVGSFIILTLFAYVYFNVSTNGWYQYYILTLPGSYQIRWSSLLSTLQTGFEVEAVIILIGYIPLLLNIRKLIQDKLHQHYYFASVGFIGTSVLARINHGAYDNTLVPAYASIAILFGLGIRWWVSRFELRSGRNKLFLPLMWLAISLQFIWLGYNPFSQIPTQADRMAGDALVTEIHNVPGDVLVPYDNYLSLFAGKKTYFHFVAFNDVRSLRTKTRPDLRNILQQFHSTPFSLLIMDLPDNFIQNNHCASSQVIQYASATTFYPITGYSVRPTTEYFDCS